MTGPGPGPGPEPAADAARAAAILAPDLPAQVEAALGACHTRQRPVLLAGLAGGRSLE